MLARADASLEQARILLDAGHCDGAADRAYYAMFHAASALLLRRGMTFRSHHAVHAAFGREFAKAGLVEHRYHRMLINAFDLRQEADYASQAEVDPTASRRACENAKDFVEMVRAFLSKDG